MIEKPLCEHCYKMLISMQMILPPLTYQNFPDPDGQSYKYKFTRNHDECSCCYAQVERMTAEVDKILAKEPDFPVYLQIKILECCCH